MVLLTISCPICHKDVVVDHTPCGQVWFACDECVAKMVIG